MSYRDRHDDPPHRSSYDEVARSLHEMDEIKAQGIFGLLRLRWEAWLEERASGHIKRREKSRQIALKAKRETIDEMVATARSAEAAGLDRDRQIIASIQSQQQRMVVEASVQPARLIPAPPRSVASLPYDENSDADRADSPDSAAPPARPYMTDAQIDKIARQFLTKFPVGDDFEETWFAYSRTLESAVPSQARAEIKERARVILGLNDSADTNVPPRSGA